MHAPTARDILSAWEAGEPQHPLDRALTLLRLAAPGETRSALARLPIGERDARLLALREQLLGREIEAFARCPRCAESIECGFTTDDIRAPAPRNDAVDADRDDPTHEMSCGEWTLDFRLPDSRDLAAVARAPDRDRAVATLAVRCLVSGRRGGARCEAGDLPAETVALWRQRLAEFDPQADTRLEFECPACAHRWSEVFDIAAFLWAEVAAEARPLLREVDLIARAYGWSEGKILALGRVRREAYLEMIRP